MGRLFLLFTIVPLLELYLLLWVGRAIGFWPTVAMVAVTALVGATLAKREGLKVLRTWQATLAQGRMPEEGLLGALLVLVGGVLLVAPGVMTDTVGLLLLFPPSRRVIAKVVRQRIDRSLRAGTLRVSGFPPPPSAGPAQPTDDSWRRATRLEGDGQVEDAEVVEDAAADPSGKRPV